MQDAVTSQVCTGGAFTDVPCGALPDGGSDPAGECQAGVCVHECDPTLAPKSSFGCEFWTAVQDNGIAAGLFKGGTVSGQGTQPSEFGFVVSNHSSLDGVAWATSPWPVLSATDIKDNYLGLTIDDAKVLTVQVDGNPVAAGSFSALVGTTYKAANLPVAAGVHTVVVTPKTGVTSGVGAGVTVYGFDNYVSYGYTGGLDLATIVSGISP